jgi:hypothetical protein
MWRRFNMREAPVSVTAVKGSKYQKDYADAVIVHY